MVPRIKGRVGEDDDKKGDFYAEISVWDLTGTEEMFDPFTIGPFKSTAEAEAAMITGIKSVSEAIEDFMGMPAHSAKFIDMKDSGKLKEWSQFVKH